MSCRRLIVVLFQAAMQEGDHRIGNKISGGFFAGYIVLFFRIFIAKIVSDGCNEKPAFCVLQESQPDLLTTKNLNAMKKNTLLLIVGCFMSLSMTQCRSIVDRYYDTEYKYRNNTSSTITIKCLSSRNNVLQNEFIILPENEYSLKYSFMGSSPTRPFYEKNNNISLLEIDNGEKMITDRLFPMDSSTGLFREEYYTLISETKYERHYEFIFTDDFFKNGTPLEE